MGKTFRLAGRLKWGGKSSPLPSEQLHQEPKLEVGPDFQRMAGMVPAMLKDALDAFVCRDSAAARIIINRDKEVDVLNKQIKAALERRMMEGADNVARCLQWIFAAKDLERIGDARQISLKKWFSSVTGRTSGTV